MRCTTHVNSFLLADRLSAAPPLPGVVGERLGPPPAPRFRLRTAALLDASAPRGSSSSTSSCGQVLCKLTDARSHVRGEWGKVHNGPGTAGCAEEAGEGNVTWQRKRDHHASQTTDLISFQVCRLLNGAELVDPHNNGWRQRITLHGHTQLLQPCMAEELTRWHGHSDRAPFGAPHRRGCSSAASTLRPAAPRWCSPACRPIHDEATLRWLPEVLSSTARRICSSAPRYWYEHPCAAKS